MFKDNHLHIEIIIYALLFQAVYCEKKVDFGTLSACVNKNQSLKIECGYPNCGDDNTPFNCNFYDVEENKRKLIGSSDWAMVNTNSNVSYLNATPGPCQLTINEHATIQHNKSKIYTCSLSRKTSKEEKNLTVTKETIQYNDKSKEQLKVCASAGPFQHFSGLLWSMAYIFFQETYL